MLRLRSPSSPSSSWRMFPLFTEGRVDWLTVILAVSMVGVGLLTIYSSEAASQRHTDHIFRQCWALGLGTVIAAGLMVVPYQVFRSYFWGTYLIALSSLTLVLVTGTVFRGTKGWFEIGPFRLQASEVARPLLILSFATYLDRRIPWEHFRSLCGALAVMAIPMGLLLLQPDLSGALVYVPVALGMLYLAGAQVLHLISLCGVVLVTLGLPLLSTFLELSAEDHDLTIWQQALMSALSGGWPAVVGLVGAVGIVIGVWWFLKKFKIPLPRAFLAGALAVLFLGVGGASLVQRHIKHYQRGRLMAFVSPSYDPLGSGYQVRQSEIAIGSGKVLGKGLGRTTQVRLGFLPTFHTDFIFSVVGEQFGFLGALSLMGLTFLMVWRAFDVSAHSRERFGSLIGAGVGIMFAFYGFLNIGMTLGLTPVVGVPLPLVSYGGSGLVSHLFAVGLLLSIHRHRHIL